MVGSLLLASHHSHSRHFHGPAISRMLTEMSPILRSYPQILLQIPKSHPEPFEVAHEYEFGDFQKAIQHVSRPGKTGIVSLKHQS